MPEWVLYTQDGEEIKSSDYAGKPLILSFWGTWCPHCKVLHPGLEKIRENYEDKGLEFLLISLKEDKDADPEAALKERGINIKTVVNGDHVALEKFEILGTPATFFISHEGKVLGSTMDSNPADPRFAQIAEYLINATKSE